MGEFEVVKEPTEEEEGLEERTCSVCGEKEQQTIPKLVNSVRGDLNGDGEVNAADYFKARRVYFGLVTLSEEELSLIDFDGNGTVDAGECFKLKRAIFGLTTL